MAGFWPRRLAHLGAVVLITLVLVACGSGDGLPKQPGEYVVKSKSISFDGERYIFQWAPTGRSDLSWAKTREVRLRLDDRTFLDVDGTGKATLHLTQEEPVTVLRKEQGHEYSSAWYPYYYQSGTTVIVEREYRQPVYVYPPSSSFNNGETLTGNVRSEKPADAGQIQKMQAASNTVSGQTGGTGGGNAVLNKTGPAPTGASAGANAPAPTAAAPATAPTRAQAPPPTAVSQPKVPSISTKR